MPTLLNNAARLKGTTGTNSFFITLDTAQPLLGTTPSTGTGFALVTGPNGQLQFTSTLGFVKFENSIIQTTVPNGDLTIQSTGTGRLNLNGDVFINGQQVAATTADFINLTATNLTVLGSAQFTSATNTTTFFGNVTITPEVGRVIIYSSATGRIDNVDIGTIDPGVGAFTTVTSIELFSNTATFHSIISTSAYIDSISSDSISSEISSANTLTIYDKLTVSGSVTLNPIDEDVNISPSGIGTVYINPNRTGYVDNVIIGSITPESGYFTNITTDNLTLNSVLTLTTSSITWLTAGTFTATNAFIKNLSITGTFTATNVSIENLSVTGTFTATSIYANELYDNNNRVITDLNLDLGPGITGTASVSGTTATVILTNTGVVSLVGSTGTAVSNTSGNIVIWSTATLQTVTDFGSTTTNSIKIDNISSSTTSTDGALVVTGSVGVGEDINVSGNVYSDGGVAYYNRLLYTPRVTVSATVPIDPRIGDFWIDSTAGVEYQLIPNGTSTIWVQFIGF